MARTRMSLFTLTLLFLSLSAGRISAQQKEKKEGPVAPVDDRLGKAKDYNGYFPWTAPANLDDWEIRRCEVREQVQVANGLWPMPEKTPLKAVVHGKIEREGYTIEKVYFASYPGHYVCGNLYRPTGKTGKLPAILSPHGHWANGRFYTAKDKEIDAQLKSGAEKTRESAMYPLQARCAQLARLGCVVFHYDMVGYADALQIPHRTGFLDVQADLRLQSFMGLQTYNTVRALDFLLSLPDVDPQRIGVTGASGGGTQTFILCAIDDRPAAAFPAVMVSTAMQGGCICENCSGLRIGTGNVELAGVFAPKPLGMSGANDWTKEIETKGLPELKALYKLYKADDNVMAKAHVEFGHNYNQVSREIMYNFFNKHLKLGVPGAITEKPFVPVPPKELSVFDAEHPLPKDAVDAMELRKYLTAVSDKTLQSLLPKDADSLNHLRDVLYPALQAMMTDHVLRPKEVGSIAGKMLDNSEVPYLLNYYSLSRKGANDRVQVSFLRGKDFNGQITVWVHPKGTQSVWQDGKPSSAVQKILDKKGGILAVDVFDKAPAVNKEFAGYTFGYNRPLLAERVRDILTAVGFARGMTRTVNLIGFEKAGPWVVLARGLCVNNVARTAVDMNNFSFDQVTSFEDEMMLPGVLKYGGMPVLSTLCAPDELFVHNCKGSGSAQWLTAAYQAAGRAGNLRRMEEKATAEDAVAWLMRD